MAEAKEITTLEEFEAERAKHVGKVLPATGRWYEASLMYLRLFSDGIGDWNPLYREEEYASKGRFGGVTAHPSWLNGPSIGAGVASGAFAPGQVTNKYFPINYSGVDIEWFRPIWAGDKIRLVEKVGPYVRKESQRIGPFLICSGLTEYWNQRNELVGTMNAHVARYLNIGRAIQYDRTPKPGAEQEPPDPLVWERKRRGNKTRYWEDVKEGEEIPTLKKGTFTTKEVMFWFLVCRNTTGADRSRREATEGTTYLATGHLDDKYSVERRNMPGMFADGPHTMCWSQQIALDWMGDDGWLKQYRGTVRHPNVVGDINTVYGKVAKKYIEGGEHLVDIDIENKNQAELTTVHGTATVILPSKK
ncbi:MAG: MaoC family dehydratase N-terminal domain-containing protein [Chloroflexi bacterium]|nr:MaoC family dehydratase N-terminal domain-containing protein [Chloroflexota bacterium]